MTAGVYIKHLANNTKQSHVVKRGKSPMNAGVLDAEAAQRLGSARLRSNRLEIISNPMKIGTARRTVKASPEGRRGAMVNRWRRVLD
jgi:hypothetical protein